MHSPAMILPRARPHLAELPGRELPLGSSIRRFTPALGRSSWPGALSEPRSLAPVAPMSIPRKVLFGATFPPASRSVRALRNWSSSNGFPGTRALSPRVRGKSENAMARGTNLRAHVMSPLKAPMGNALGVERLVSTRLRTIMTPGVTLHGGIPQMTLESILWPTISRTPAWSSRRTVSSAPRLLVPSGSTSVALLASVLNDMPND